MSQPELIYVCEICQTILQEHHCKAICPNCGRMFDCSDLPIMAANAQMNPNDCGMTLRPGSDTRDWLPQSVPEEERALRNDDEANRDLP